MKWKTVWFGFVPKFSMLGFEVDQNAFFMTESGQINGF